jgi:hypothetical protein
MNNEMFINTYARYEEIADEYMEEILEAQRSCPFGFRDKIIKDSHLGASVDFISVCTSSKRVYANYRVHDYEYDDIFWMDITDRKELDKGLQKLKTDIEEFKRKEVEREKKQKEAEYQRYLALKEKYGDSNA